MPFHSLPPETHLHIAQHLRGAHDDRKKVQKDLLSFSLTSKVVHGAALAELYRDVVVRAERVVDLVPLLDARKDLSALTEKLKVTSTWARTGDRDESTKAIVALVEGCGPALQSVFLEGAKFRMGEVLRAVTSTPTITSLRHLALTGYVGIDLEGLYLFLRRMPSFRSLDLRLHKMGGSHQAVPSPLSPPLRLDHLTLRMSQRSGNRHRPEPQPAHSAAFFPSFDFSSLRTFSTLVDLGSGALYSSLSSATSLTHLHLVAPRSTFSASLPAFTELLPRLTSLKSLVVEGQQTPVPANDIASTLPLTQFFAALSPSFETLRIPLFFPDGISDSALAGFLQERLSLSLKKVEAFTASSTSRAERRVLRMVKVKGDVAEGDGGASRWVEVRHFPREYP
jgi:hypothetical protein